MLAYQRTYEKILEDLRNDVYPVNSLLPPEPKLEEIYHVSAPRSGAPSRSWRMRGM